MEKKKTNYIAIQPVKPNDTIARDYYYIIEKEIKKMNKEVYDFIKENYKETNEKINNNKILVNVNNVNVVSDAGVVLNFSKTLNLIFTKYFKKFDKIAEKLSPTFINTISKFTSNKLKDNIERKLGITIPANKDTKIFSQKKQIQIDENVSLIKSIPEKYHDKISFAVNESLVQGRNLSYLTDEIQKIGSVTRRRAKNIALDQLNKATNVVNNARLNEYGITKAKWQHSGASKEPRKDHVDATGKIYEIKEGCKILGKYIQPGQLPNCKCISIPVVEI